MRIILNASEKVKAAQLDHLGQLYRQVAGISDGLGSENTDSGQVLPLAQLSFAQARRATFPAGYLFVRLTAAEFQSGFGAAPGVSSLLSFIAPYKPEFGLMGDPDWFHPDKSDRGTFWVCVHIHARTAIGHNVLLRFQRVET